MHQIGPGINPTKNALPKELNEEEVLRAIAESGYPLQMTVAASLKQHFDLTEEWSYIDRVTRQVRSLDLVGFRALKSHSHPGALSAAIRLLIECKASRLPYIFFRSVVGKPLTDFPQVEGVRAKDVMLFARAARKYPLPFVLGLHEEPFIAGGPTVCATFSKVVRKGGKLELSGKDPFLSIVLPLVSALEHSYEEQRPREESQCHPTVSLAVCVLDAPMMVSDVGSGDCRFQPWVRVVRQEATTTVSSVAPSRASHTIDIVHAAYLETFISTWLLPFALVFESRVANKPYLLRDLRGSVHDLDSWRWEDLAD